MLDGLRGWGSASCGFGVVGLGQQQSRAVHGDQGMRIQHPQVQCFTVRSISTGLCLSG